jgi:hypothetical protein
MLDTLLLKKAFNLKVLELCPVVASYLFNSQSALIFELVLRIPLRSLGFELFPAKRIPK